MVIMHLEVVCLVKYCKISSYRDLNESDERDITTLNGHRFTGLGIYCIIFLQNSSE